jgi:nuclear pore complex protein Nup160
MNANSRVAHGKAIGMLSDMSAGLLTVDDTEYFHSGLNAYLQHILGLFESVDAYSFAADFARLALAALANEPSHEAEEQQDDILSSLFMAEVHCCHYNAAYIALTQLSNQMRQESSAIAWIDAMLGRKSLPRLEATETVQLLQRLPLDMHAHIIRVVDEHLTTLAQNQASVPGLSRDMWSSDNGTDYMKILYALRVGRQDYRGAISVMMDRLYLIKKSNKARNDPQARALRHTLLALINILSCVAPDEAYIVTPVRESMSDTTQIFRDVQGRDMETGWKDRKRIIITLEDLRREYQQLLDKCSRIERGDFDFDADAEDEEEESEVEGAGATNEVDAMEF